MCPSAKATLSRFSLDQMQANSASRCSCEVKGNSLNCQLCNSTHWWTISTLRLNLEIPGSSGNLGSGAGGSGTLWSSCGGDGSGNISRVLRGGMPELAGAEDKDKAKMAWELIYKKGSTLKGKQSPQTLPRTPGTPLLLTPSLTSPCYSGSTGAVVPEVVTPVTIEPLLGVQTIKSSSIW